MYSEKTARGIAPFKQYKLWVKDWYAFICTKSLTYIPAYTVKPVQNLCQPLQRASRSNHDREMDQVMCIYIYNQWY